MNETQPASSEVVFPYAVEVLRHVWIPMRDDTRLAARIWLPADTREVSVPAILEYIPYRKNDATATRDGQIHPYFAGHGFASIRVDLRGSGDSEGILRDEYLPQEQQDGLDVLRWLAEQEWCNGSVGIIGKSWGGFNGLQIAAHQPEQLRAVISVCSSDDRYATDVHYMGGCLLGSEMLQWSSTFLAYNGRPPDPAVLGERWRQVWLERLEETEPWGQRWLEHPLRDDYWKQGSACESLSSMISPIFMVGGWADPYSDSVLRFVEAYRGPCLGLIGPWAHQYPHDALPGPSIGFLQECLRWWNHWLKGVNTGIMNEPRLRVWMPGTEKRGGRWLAEESLASERIHPETYALARGPMSKTAEASPPQQFHGVQGCGLDAGRWLALGDAADFPPDQRAEDGLSLTFDSEPLTDAMEILGFPWLTLACSVDRPNALLVGRLCDVWPDGASLLVTRGLLNLTHREGHERPTPLQPGCEYVWTLVMSGIAHRFEAGHRIRLALSPTYWPWAWPSPQPVTLTVAGGACGLVLPVRDAIFPESTVPTFLPPETAVPLGVEQLAGTSSACRRITINVGLCRRELTERYACFPAVRLSDGLEYSEDFTDEYAIEDDDPLSATAVCRRTVAVSRGSWRTRVVTKSTMTGDSQWFHVTNQLDAYEGSVRVFTRAWSSQHRRQHV